MLIENAGVKCCVQTMCPICGDSSDVVHLGLEDQLFGAKGRWGVRRCNQSRCSLMWLDPMPLPNETHKFYATYYTHIAEANQSESAANDPGAAPKRRGRRLVKRVLSRVLIWRRNAFLSDHCHLEGLVPGNLLEVGCGNGRFLLEASKAGWRATGIDFDENAIMAARAIPGVVARVGDLRTMKYGNGVFDAVVMNNVIEHLPRPAEVFAECARVLKHGGRLVMITPNSRSLGYKLFGRDWRGLEIPRHLHIFSPASLSAMARKSNFRRVSAFSSAGGETGAGMILASENIRQKHLKCPVVPRVGVARRIIRREIVLSMLGLEVGEFAVLVAHK